MTNGDLCKMLEGCAVAYLNDPKAAINNRHMNRLKKKDRKHLKGRVVEAVLIDYLNFVASCHGMDLGLNSRNIGTEL